MSSTPHIPDATAPYFPGTAGETAGLFAGRFQLRETLGEGGMGVVWLADQSEPIQRPVAIKLIKASLQSEQALARFENERLALAAMDHPHIAKVFDAGTADGQLYFVMELIQGQTLTSYCDLNRLTVRDRLHLFVAVCQAIQHAHQKGIIHRDIKPSNILVTEVDGRPVPKVIDFGVAKAASAVWTGQTLFTQAAGPIGTPEYMSPEQASLDPIDIDTRSDVYALGVVLYELLTGSTPFGRPQASPAAMLEMLRCIRDEEPPRPSTKLSQTPAQLSTIATVRQVEPHQLQRLLRGDLEWVLLKALAKDRERRYDSANSLGQEIQRYLANEPVLAGPPGAAYRAAKFIKRNQATVVAGTLVVASLVGGLIGTTWGLLDAHTQQQIALAREGDAKRAAVSERTARTAAEKRLTQLEKVNEILRAIFVDLNPVLEGKDEPSLSARLGRRLTEAAAKINGEAVGDAATVARLQATLGYALLPLGYQAQGAELLATAAATLEAERGADDPETRRALRESALALGDAGRFEAAIALQRRLLARQRALSGPEHGDAIAAGRDLANTLLEAGRTAEALTLLEDAKLAVARRPPDDAERVEVERALAHAYANARRYREAAELLERCLAAYRKRYGPDHMLTLTVEGDLGTILHGLGRRDEALPLLERGGQKLRAKLGADHPAVLIHDLSIAQALVDAGRTAEARRLAEHAYETLCRHPGPDHPYTLRALVSLAATTRAAGRLEPSITLYEQALKQLRRRFGPDHPSTLGAAKQLARLYYQASRREQAVTLYEETYRRLHAAFGPDHIDTLETLNFLAVALWSRRQLDRSVPLFEQALPRFTRALGADHLQTLTVKANLGVNYRDAGRLADAIVLLEQVQEHAHPYPSLAWVGAALVTAYQQQGEPAKALTLLRTQLAAGRQRVQPDSTALANLLETTASQLLDLRQAVEAEPLLRECLALRSRITPGGWSVPYLKALLGGALAEQGKFDEAEPLLRAGCEALLQRADQLPRNRKGQVRPALERLVKLYEALGKPADAAQWRASLQTHASPGSPTR